MNVDTSVGIALRLVREFEGFRARPYLCPAGVPTIGYGSTTYRTGRAVTLRDPAITEEVARGLAADYLRRVCLPAVVKLTPGANTEGRVAALLDFVYNLGADRLRVSTLRRRVAAGDWDGAAAEFRKWVYAGGVPLAGLVRRRAAEIELL